ncbi:hypothetical protein ACN47E_001796 [Coniothyrium glycines]
MEAALSQTRRSGMWTGLWHRSRVTRQGPYALRLLPSTALHPTLTYRADRAHGTNAPLPGTPDNNLPPPPSRVEYNIIEEVEPLVRYTAGGYYPMRIGDRLSSSRYHVIHKLGYGSFSTIWLARDEHLHRYVALKIAVSERNDRVESNILRCLQDNEAHSEQRDSGNELIPNILDAFEVEGPSIHGSRAKHHCIVTTPARATLSGAREASYNSPFKPEVAHAIAAQLVQAVALIHSRGVIHADLHEGNILVHLPSSIDNLSVDELYNVYAPPYLEPIKRTDGLPLDPWVPSHGVVPVWFQCQSDTLPLAEASIFLNDFGESWCPTVNKPSTTRTPYILRSPELLLDMNAPVSFSSEIWSLACAIFHVMGARPLFDAWASSEYYVVREQVALLGALPEHLWDLWENREMLDSERVQSLNEVKPRSLEDHLEHSVQIPRRAEGTTVMTEEEKQDFFKLLGSMLTYRIEDRPTAQQVLEADWVQNWALPALEARSKCE